MLAESMGFKSRAIFASGRASCELGTDNRGIGSVVHRFSTIAAKWTQQLDNGFIDGKLAWFTK